MSDVGGKSTCGLCGQVARAHDLTRGRKLSLCRGCVEHGLLATLDSTRTHRDGEDAPRAYESCSVCGERTSPPTLYRAALGAACTTCLYESYNLLTQMLETTARRRKHFPGAEEGTVADLLGGHFEGRDATDVVSASREFPLYLRADLQLALDALFEEIGVDCIGFRARYSHETVDYASLLQRDHYPVVVAPLQYEDVDIGEHEPVRCVRQGLWLAEVGGLRCAVIVVPAQKHGLTNAWHVEIAVPVGPAGEELVRNTFRKLEAAIQASASYRGKVLSLESERHFAGMAAGNMVVQRLEPVAREEIEPCWARSSIDGASDTDRGE